MKRLSLGPLYYEFSRHNEPRLRVEPLETILVETEDPRLAPWQSYCRALFCLNEFVYVE